MKTSVPVTVTILDINDSPPRFQQKEYNNTISELTEVGADVLTVTASDPDSVRKRAGSKRGRGQRERHA